MFGETDRRHRGTCAGVDLTYAASSGRDTDFTAKLVDVFPDGRAIHLAEGILRARHRNGFEVGHCRRVEISRSNFPRFDRNLNTGVRIQIAHQTILHTQSYPSHILLPIIPGA